MLTQRVTFLEKEINKQQRVYSPDFDIDAAEEMLPMSNLSPLKLPKPISSALFTSPPAHQIPNDSTIATSFPQSALFVSPPANSTFVTSNITDSKEKYKQLIEGLTIGLYSPTKPKLQTPTSTISQTFNQLSNKSNVQSRLSMDKPTVKAASGTCPDVAVSNEQWNIALETQKPLHLITTLQLTSSKPFRS